MGMFSASSYSSSSASSSGFGTAAAAACAAASTSAPVSSASAAAAIAADWRASSNRFCRNLLFSSRRFFFWWRRCVLSSACSLKNSGGVRLSRNSWYLWHSSSCSEYLLSSLLMVAMAAFSRLISCTLSCLALASTSARLMASCTFSSFSLRKASKRTASSSSICSLLRRASSRWRARSSSLRISARFVSRLICTRKISRFFAMKSAMFSFSLRRWSVGRACAAASSRWPGMFIFASSPATSSGGLVVDMRDENVPFSCTFSDFMSSRSSRFRRFSSSRMRNTSSSGGIRNGFFSMYLSTAASTSSSLCLGDSNNPPPSERLLVKLYCDAGREPRWSPCAEPLIELARLISGSARFVIYNSSWMPPGCFPLETQGLCA
mmetsp:Transcript_40524/g.67902  ORF Transcript_40524/g.67902 Transcript_40524/m.67902 type:complete len:378 (-) Transcript_40524:239-1372(-)